MRTTKRIGVLKSSALATSVLLAACGGNPTVQPPTPNAVPTFTPEPTEASLPDNEFHPLTNCSNPGVGFKDTNIFQYFERSNLGEPTMTFSDEGELCLRSNLPMYCFKKPDYVPADNLHETLMELGIRAWDEGDYYCSTDFPNSIESQQGIYPAHKKK